MTKPVIVQKWHDAAPKIESALRIVAAILFILSGTTKLFAFPGGIPPNGGTVPFMSQAWIGAFLECFGGIFILMGLYTRPVAFLLAGEMAVAYFQFHAPKDFWPTINGGAPAILYCFIWLYFSATGPGPWSLDAKRGKQ
ncbi:MAG: DoxX family protein [bacterium]